MSATEKKAEPGSLQRAIEIAVEGHRGQLTKDGLPYVTHSLHLMSQVSTEVEKIVAALHDVVEDTEFTREDLQAEGFSEAVLEAVDLLTHSDGMDYGDYIERLSGHPVARRVKLADLSHNMDYRRIPELSGSDLERMRRYHDAWQKLSNLD